MKHYTIRGLHDLTTTASVIDHSIRRYGQKVDRVSARVGEPSDSRNAQIYGSFNSFVQTGPPVLDKILPEYSQQRIR